MERFPNQTNKKNTNKKTHTQPVKLGFLKVCICTQIILNYMLNKKLNKSINCYYLFVVIIFQSQRHNIYIKCFCTNLINPQLSNDDIIDSSSDFLPRVMVTCFGEFAVGSTQGRYQQIFTTELTAHGEVLPQCPSTPFRVVS